MVQHLEVFLMLQCEEMAATKLYTFGSFPPLQFQLLVRYGLSELNSELKLDAHVSFVNFTSGSFGYAVQLVGDFGTASLGWSDTEIYFDREEGGRWRRVWTLNPPAAKV